MSDNTKEELRKPGQSKEKELDKLWDAIRQSLRNSAMGYMDIPHAQEFQVRATVNIGPLVRDLVDYELEQLLDELEKEVFSVTILPALASNSPHDRNVVFLESIEAKRKEIKDSKQ